MSCFMEVESGEIKVLVNVTYIVTVEGSIIVLTNGDSIRTNLTYQEILTKITVATIR